VLAHVSASGMFIVEFLLKILHSKHQKGTSLWVVKNTVNQRKGLKTLRWTITLSALRQNSECGVANVRTTADCNQLFRFSAWLGQKINFRYAVGVALVLVLAVSIRRSLCRESDYTFTWQSVIGLPAGYSWINSWVKNISRLLVSWQLQWLNPSP